MLSIWPVCLMVRDVLNFKEEWKLNEKANDIIV